MEPGLTGGDLLRIAGGTAYLEGLYSAIEGLAGRPRVKGNTVLGRVFWDDTYRTRLQVVPPFESRCTCPKAGACRHVVTLGLTFLHQSRRRDRSAPAPADEATCYKVAFLMEQYLRCLVLELIAAQSGGLEVAADFLTRARNSVEYDDNLYLEDYRG